MSEKFVFELVVGKEVHKIIFPSGQGRRQLHASNGTLVGHAILDAKGLRVEFKPDAAERLAESN